MIEQQNPDKVFTGEGKDTIGPGHYNINRELVKKSKGTNWHASNVQRRTFYRTNKENSLGPGTYNVDKNSSFVSQRSKDFSSYLSGDRIIKSTVIGFGSEYSRYYEDSETESEEDKVILLYQ